MSSTYRLYVFMPVTLVALLFGGSGLVTASSANISHSYKGSKDIVEGSLVSLDSEQDNYVQAANTRTANRLVGIAVGKNDSLVAIDSDVHEVQVATSGVAVALVSDLNGTVKNGDQIAVSPFSGIGMKAEPGTRLIGLAQSSLSSKEAGATTREVTDRDGKKQKITVGFVRVSIAIGSAPQSSNSTGENMLQRLARSITGHAVSNTRIIISSFIAIIALIALVTLIYTSVYGTIIAVGRNPLAKSSIFRALLSIMALVAITSVVALGTIYLIIR